MLKLISVAKKTILRYPVLAEERPFRERSRERSRKLSDPGSFFEKSSIPRSLDSCYVLMFFISFNGSGKVQKKGEKNIWRQKKTPPDRAGFFINFNFFSEREIVDRFGDITCRLYPGGGTSLGLGSISAFGSAGVTAAAFGAPAT